MAVTRIVRSFAAEIPPCMMNTWVKPPQGGFAFNRRNMEKKQKVIVYVDGYNFYYGLKNGGQSWRLVYWLDVVSFFERMMLSNQELVKVNYFSARPVDDPQAYNNQNDFFEANGKNPRFKLHLGRYKKSKLKCQNCGFKNKMYEEKETDVRVATSMLSDVFTNRCDVTVVVSADSDMIPSVEIIKRVAPNHRVLAFVPPNQRSYALINKCDGAVWLEHYKARFIQCMLPDEVMLENGHILHRPDNWK